MKQSIIFWGLLLAGLFTLQAQTHWQQLAKGLEWGTFHADVATPVGNAEITVLRIDPAQYELRLLGISETGGTEGMTARQWCKHHQLIAATNAGMFMTDYRTHVGKMQTAAHSNNSRFNDYQSVAAFDPVSDTLPSFQLFDLDQTNKSTISQQYRGVLQNLRLIKKPGVNRWGQQNKKWSEAALGEDQDGNILFIFSRSPFTMRDFNRMLLRLPLNLVAAQHLEGGPEAQLFFEFGTHSFEGFGSYETHFYESDDNQHPWPVPNVLGIVKRK